MSTDERVERSRLLYERAIFEGDAGALATADRELDAVEADLALARGRVIHGRFLHEREQGTQPEQDPAELAFFERAAQLYSALRDVRGEAQSLFWTGCFHQVVRRDNDAAVPVLKRSRELAEQAGDIPTLSEVLRHLGIAEHAAGPLDSARAYLEQSSQLRREAGLLPGVAANMVGLIYIAAAQGRDEDALALAQEAAALAEASGAPVIARQVQEARAQAQASAASRAP